jgi:hypothetical protein
MRELRVDLNFGRRSLIFNNSEFRLRVPSWDKYFDPLDGDFGIIFD